MKILKVALITVVVLSGFMNMMLINKVDNLENKVITLQHQTSQINSTITSIPNQVSTQVNHLLNQIKKIESWVTPINIESESLNSESVTLKANWQVKDYTEDSVVIFHYKLKGEEFKQLKATMKENGYFEAVFPLDVNLEPNWEIEFRGEFTERTFRAIEETMTNDGEKNMLQYYVSMKNKQQVKSSEMNYYHLNRISNRLYGTLVVHFEARNNKIDSISINPKIIPTEVSIENVVVNSYKGKELLSTKVFNSTIHQEEDLRTFHIQYENEKQEQDFDRLLIEVMYSDGKTFSREVYSTK